MDTITSIKDNDIFRWYYRDKHKPSGFDPYWCRSQIAIARNGQLFDTYWNDFSKPVGTYQDAPQKLELQYLGNFDELVGAPPYMAEYYDAKDCVNIRHVNSSANNFFIRKDAKRSAEKMRAAIEEKIADAKCTINSAQGYIESLERTLQQIESGEPLDKIYI